jgi:hypothetical protein
VTLEEMLAPRRPRPRSTAFDFTDVPPADGLVGEIARAALDLAEHAGAPSRRVATLRRMLHAAEGRR